MCCVVVKLLAFVFILYIQNEMISYNKHIIIASSKHTALKSLGNNNPFKLITVTGVYEHLLHTVMLCMICNKKYGFHQSRCRNSDF